MEILIRYAWTLELAPLVEMTVDCNMSLMSISLGSWHSPTLGIWRSMAGMEVPRTATSLGIVALNAFSSRIGARGTRVQRL